MMPYDRHKPKQLSRDKALMRRIVEALCGMCCEPDPPEYDDVSDVAPSAMGAQALDTLACHCASTAVHPQVREERPGLQGHRRRA